MNKVMITLLTIATLSLVGCLGYSAAGIGSAGGSSGIVTQGIGAAGGSSG